MNKQFKRYLQITLLVLDLLMLNIAYLLPRLFFKGRIADDYFSSYLSFWVFTNVIWLLLSFISGCIHSMS
jgi:hypothetical protein